MTKMKNSMVSFLVLIGVALFGTFGAEITLASATMGDVTATMDSTSATYYMLSVTVTSVDPIDINPRADGNEYYRLGIATDGSATLYPQDTQTDAADYYFIGSSFNSVPDTNSKYTLTYTVKVIKKDGTIPSSGYKIKVGFLAGTSTSMGDISKTGIEVKASIIAVDKAPSGFIPAGTQEAVSVSWNKEEAAVPVVAPTGTPATPVTPSGTTVFLFKRTAGVTSLDAKVFSNSATATTDESTTCDLDLEAATGGQCVTCSNKYAYLDPDVIAAKYTDKTQVQINRVAANVTSTTFSGLENDMEYVVFAMYHPKGIQRSACLIATPSPDVTWAEANGEDDAKREKYHCFIATAAYGSPFHKNLYLFRWFRGHVLLKTALGKKFVRWYYRVGPELAKPIAAYPALAAVVRTVLWVPALMIIGIKLAATYGAWTIVALFAVAGAMLMSLASGMNMMAFMSGHKNRRQVG